MMGRAIREGLVDPGRSSQVGIRTFHDEDMGLQILTAPWVHRNGIGAALEAVVARAGDAPVYLSFDIDGLDPAFAPGTGTPVPGGLASWQALEFVRGLAPLEPRGDGRGRGLAALRPCRDHRARGGAPGARLAVRAGRQGRCGAAARGPSLGAFAWPLLARSRRHRSAAEFIDRLPEAFRSWLAGRRVEEVECVIADIAGVSRGKAMPFAKFMREDRMFLPTSIFHQTIAGDYVDMDMPTSGPSPTWC